MPHVEANGLRFHVQVLKPADAGGSVDGGGDAAPRPKVVMLHGLVIDNLSSWYYTIAPAVAMHADVYLIDFILKALDANYEASAQALEDIENLKEADLAANMEECNSIRSGIFV